MTAPVTDAGAVVEVELATGDAALPLLAEAGWDELLDRSGHRDPLRRLDVLSRPDPFAADEEPRALVVRRAGRPVAAAPLAARRERALVVVRHLGPLSLCFDPEPPALDAQALDALAVALLSQPGDLLVLEEMAPDDGLARALARCDPRLEVRDPVHAFTAQLDAPTAALARRRRQAAQHARRAARAGVALDASYRARWEEVEPRLDEALELLARSWRGRRPDPYTGTPEGRRMLRETLERLGREGGVRLSGVEAAGRLVAFHIAIVWPPGAVLFKTAYDRTLSGVPGLGWRSLITMLDGLAAEGIRHAGMGTGGDDYKAHAASPRPLVTVRAALSHRGRAWMRLAASRRAVRRRRSTLVVARRAGARTEGVAASRDLT